MSYEITAARKRPRNFEELAGQDFVSATLAASLQTGRIAHAYLFSGPRGCGKTSTARILSKALNCESGPTPHPCGNCDSCVAIAAGSSLDVIEIDGASNTSVDNIRQIKDEVLFPPNSGKYKIYIIDEVHMLSTNAFNALLKTIEEPPPYIVFIFATTEIHKVPATIKSRCQQFAFRLIPIEKIKSLLATVAAEIGVPAEDEALLWIAKESGGSLRDAYTLFDQVLSFSDDIVSAARIREKLGLVGTDRLNVLFGHCIAGGTGAALETLDDILGRGISPEQAVVDMAEYCRSILLLRHGIRRESLLGASAAAFDAAVVEGLGGDTIERALAALLETYRNLRYTVDPRFELELTVARLSRLGDFISRSDLAKTVSALRRFVAGEGGTGPAIGAGDGERERERMPREGSRETREFSASGDRGSTAGFGGSPAREAQYAGGNKGVGATPGPGTTRDLRSPEGRTLPRDRTAGGEEGSPTRAATSGGTAEPAAAGTADPVCEECDVAALREGVVADLGRSNPMLRTGLQASSEWCLQGSRLVIPFAVLGIEQKLVRDSLGILAESVSKRLGRAVRVELTVEDSSRGTSGGERSAGMRTGHGNPEGQGESPDPVRVVEEVFRGQRVVPPALKADRR